MTKELEELEEQNEHSCVKRLWPNVWKMIGEHHGNKENGLKIMTEKGKE